MLSTLFDASSAESLDRVSKALDALPASGVAALLAEIARLEPGLVADRSLDPPLDDEALERLFDAGLFTLTVPAEYGGLDASQRDYVRVLEQLGRLGPAYPMTAVPHLCVSVKSVSRLALTPLREDVLRGLAAQRRLLAFAITEEYGSDVASMRCRLIRAADGTLRLRGRKEWITNLARASHVVVGALCPDFTPVPGAAVLVLVPLSSPGVRVGEKWEKLIANGSDTATLHFNDVVVTPDWLLGTPGHGMRHFADLVQQGRLGAASALVGMARQAVDAGRNPMGDGGSERLAARLDVLSAVIAFTATLGDMEHPDYPHAVSLAKAFAGAEAQRVINDVEQALLAGGEPLPPDVRRARQASGLFRLLKGPGEVISYQAIAALTTRWMGLTLRDRQLSSCWPSDSAHLIAALIRRVERLFGREGDGRNQSLLLALADSVAAVFSHLAARVSGCGRISLDWSETRADEMLRRLDVLLDDDVLCGVDEWFDTVCRVNESGRLNYLKP